MARTISMLLMVAMATSLRGEVKKEGQEVKKGTYVFRAYSQYGLTIECEGISKGHPAKKAFYLASAKKNAIDKCTKAGFQQDNCSVARNDLVDMPETSSFMPGACVGWALVIGSDEDGKPVSK